MLTPIVQLRSTAQPRRSQDSGGVPPAHGQSANELRDLLVHDIRSPLAAIRGYTQLLGRRAAAGQLNIVALLDMLEHVESAVGRVEGLLDDLAWLPVLHHGRMAALRRQPTDLVQLAQQVAAASEAAGLGNCRVVVLSSVPQMVGEWDAAFLERALANLIDNALKYSRENGPVAVTLRQAETCAVISVSDQGVGIPAADLARVCERGYRASNVRGQFNGTGLGLSGVHEIVAEHGGTIDVSSQIGVGTKVTLHLPLVGSHQCVHSDPV